MQSSLAIYQFGEIKNNYRKNINYSILTNFIYFNILIFLIKI